MKDNKVTEKFLTLSIAASQEQSPPLIQRRKYEILSRYPTLPRVAEETV
jgi:hypothetical protein